MKAYSGGLILLLIVLLVPIASASYITMQITVEETADGNTINITNLGDEAAYRVQIISKVLDGKYESDIKDTLAPNESYSAIAEVNLSDKIPGNYPLLTTIHYQDANGYLFSALHASLVENKEEPTRSEIVLQFDGLQIRDKAKIKVAVKNFGEDSKELELFLFMSDEFIVSDNIRKINIGSKKSEEAVFEVENFGARPESTYAFFAIAEYDKDGRHHTTITPGRIHVLKKSTLFDIKIILAALALIVLIMIVLQFSRRKSRRRK